MAYDLSKDISNLAVKETRAQPDELTINISDPFKVFSHALQEGMSVEVDLGTVSEHSLLFRGRIYKIDNEFPEDDVPGLRVLAYDTSMSMGLRERNRPFSDMTLSDIVSEIAGGYFDAPSIKVSLREQGDLRFSGNGIRQDNKTDLNFLYRLAYRYGCEMFVTPEDRGDRFYFKAQYKIMTQEPDVTLYHGRCDTSDKLLNFHAVSAVDNIQIPRSLSGIDFSNGEPAQITTSEVENVAETVDPFADENMNTFAQHHPDRAGALAALIENAGLEQKALRKELGSARREAVPTPTSDNELTVLAANQFSTSILGMRANGAVYGNPRLHAQSAVMIADVGGRFSGTWYLAEVRHLLDERGYLTEFECQR